MNITVVSAPPYEPVTLAEVYAALRLDLVGSPPTHPDDATLLRMIRTSREEVEAMTRRSLVQQTLRLSLSDFPVDIDTWGARSARARALSVVAIRLARPPVASVVSVKYYDAANALVTVDPIDYYVTDEEVPELRFVSTFVPPTVYNRRDAVRIEYVAGYAPSGSPLPATQEEYAANIPSALKDAIILGVQLLYDVLTPADAATTRAAREALVATHRVALAA